MDDNGVAYVELDDADKANALDKRLSDELADAVAAAVSCGARVLVLSACGPVFCAGGSLIGLLKPQHPLSALYAGVEALSACSLPTIALVDGAAVGAGVTLPLACDVIICTPRARFDPRFLDIAIHPGGGHLWRLASRIGVQGAAALVLFGDELDGEEAERAGLALPSGRGSAGLRRPPCRPGCGPTGGARAAHEADPARQRPAAERD
jgi:enoyl-CoA hydratase